MIFFNPLVKSPLHVSYICRLTIPTFYVVNHTSLFIICNFVLRVYKSAVDGVIRSEMDLYSGLSYHPGDGIQCSSYVW